MKHNGKDMMRTFVSDGCGVCDKQFVPGDVVRANPDGYAICNSCHYEITNTRWYTVWAETLKIHWVKLKRMIYRESVIARPTSPFYRVRVDVIRTVLGKSLIVDTFTIPLQEDYNIDLEGIQKRAPRAHGLTIRYPSDWEDQIEKAREG